MAGASLSEPAAWGRAATGWRARVTWIVALLAAVGFAALLGSLIAANGRANDARDRAAAWQIHTYQVLVITERLQGAVFDAQRAGRGYLLSDGRDETLLTPYQSAAERVPALLAALRTATRDNEGQQRRIAWLSALVDIQMQRMKGYVGLRPDQIPTARAGSLGPGETTVTRIRGAIGDIVADEQRLLAVRTARSRDADAAVHEAARSLSITGSILALLALLAGSLSISSILRTRRLAAEAVDLAASRVVLEEAVAQRTAEITASKAALEEEVARAQAAEAQVRQMQKLESVGQLTGGIAHDFNNMLAVVIGSLDLALRRLDDPEGRVRKYVDNAMEGAKRAASLTARLLAFSRQQALAPEPIDANTFVGGISELLRRTLGEGVQIETVLAGGLWRTYADAGELENAIVNLAVNARDAMEGKGKLTIETANTHLDDAYARAHADVVAGQYVVCCVTDTGTGMPKAVIDKAFDPFFTTKTVGKGTGLGLSQVFGFVKQSGGHVKIYSEPGKGTTVKLYLPRWTGADAPAREAMPEGPMPRARAGEIVVVVEDEENVRLVTVDALRDLGYGVFHANNGHEALDLLGTLQRVDLLFTDIVMPNMTGRELADEARNRRADLKVLYTTGYTKNAVVHNGMLDAQVAFLPKPFSILALAVKVRQVLDGGGVNRMV